MSDLLPNNATKVELALDKIAQKSTSFAVPVGTLFNPDTIDISLAPFMAWALSVDAWDESWPEEIKRDVLRTAIEIHRYKGSVYAVELSLAKAGLGDSEILEGRNKKKRDGTLRRDGFVLRSKSLGWHEFKVICKSLLSNSQADLARKLLQKSKPTRSILWGFDFTGSLPKHNGVIKRDGNYKRGIA